MKLYYSKKACSFAVRTLIHELNVPCDFEAVDLKTKKTEHGKDFLKINPKGYVPVLITSKNEVITENVVIQQYLADMYKAHQLLPPVGDLKRYRVLEWLNYISSDVHKSCSPLFNAQVPDQSKTDILKPILINRLQFLNQALIKGPFLLEEQYTLPDTYLFVILMWLKRFDIKVTDFPNLNRYFIELHKRPPVIKALKEEE